jgi:uncharacterized glyoxalase superfamily protein PhnB
MPPGTIIPELAYPDVREAVEWLCRKFGFVERLRIANHRVQLTFGEGSIVVIELSKDPGTSNSETSPSTSSVIDHSIMVRVADVDSHHERARQAGARIVNPPTDSPFGERQYTAYDFAGHRWTFTQTIADVDPGSWGGVLLE